MSICQTFREAVERYQARLGGLERADGYRQEAEKLFLSNGAFRQASNARSTGFGDSFSRWQAVATTAWYVLLANRDNAMEPLP